MLLTLGSDAKNSMRTEGTSAKSVGHLVPEKNYNQLQQFNSAIVH